MTTKRNSTVIISHVLPYGFVNVVEYMYEIVIKNSWDLYLVYNMMPEGASQGQSSKQYKPKKCFTTPLCYSVWADKRYP